MRLSSRGVVLAAGLIAGACGELDGEVSVPGLPYSFPRSQVEAVVRSDQGATFVKLRPAGEGLLLIFDERVERKQKRTGTVIVSRLNYSSYGHFETFKTAGETVVCDDALHFNCGFKIDDQGIQWSVTFDRGRLPEVALLKRKATELIRSYRRINLAAAAA